ncbi:MAG: hypothetical protein LBP22_15220 [Deltaproteobacteria bacterium]|jgi:hypothetical protein|nr:hypothetical protein [Deltaproteobacteria bacterium]
MEIRRKNDPNIDLNNVKTLLNGYYAEDVESKNLRTAGVEYVALHAVEQLKVPQILSSLGFNDK